MNLEKWLFYKGTEFKSEPEQVIWEIFDYIFKKEISPFRDMLDRLIDGFGYSIGEDYGFAMYNDNDEPKDLPYVLIYVSNKSYELGIHRFLILLKIACDFYITYHPENKIHIEAAYQKIID